MGSIILLRIWRFILKLQRIFLYALFFGKQSISSHNQHFRGSDKIEN